MYKSLHSAENVNVVLSFCVDCFNRMIQSKSVCNWENWNSILISSNLFFVFKKNVVINHELQKGAGSVTGNDDPLPQVPNRFSSVIERIERLYKVICSSVW